MVLSLPGSNRACAGWKLGCHRERRSEHLTEEGADQPLDVLGSRCQEELLANELHSAQTQPA